MKRTYWYSFLFAAAATTLAACSSDEPAAGGLMDGETAYLNVSLRDANDITRAGEGGDLTPGEDVSGDYEYGTGNEGKVASARFFFFDSKGIYTGQSTVWNGGSPGTEPNIELKGNSVVVLDNLKGNQYPRYMVTVLNGGAQYTNDFMTGKNIGEFSKDLTTWGENTDGGFVMATSSYFQGTPASDKTHEDARYFATVLDENNFARSAEEAKNVDPVNVYVERLAARVHLNCEKEFPIKLTVMGADGNNPDSGDAEAATNLKVRIDGWYLNGIQQQSYLSKQFGSWTSAASLANVDGWAWNVPVFHRSFWGQSVNYGKQTEDGLVYYPWNNDNVLQAGQYAYCNENTSDYANLSKDNNNRPNQRLLTSVVLKATICAADGTPLDIVEHNGVYFTTDRFIKYVLDNASRSGKLNYYTRTGTEGNYQYTQVQASMFELKGTNDRVQVAKGSSFPTVQLYTKEGTETSAANLDSDLAALTADAVTRAFKNGAMYYNIPVSHLNKKTYDANGDLATWFEGSFGVVRNHTYEITVNSVKRLGQGIFNPDSEEVKPNKDPKDPNWFLGATINVLSWKIVASGVDL